MTPPEDAIVRHGDRAILIARHAGTVDRFARRIARLIPCGVWLARRHIATLRRGRAAVTYRVRAPVGLRCPTERRASVGQPSIYQELLTVWRPTACRISTSTVGQGGQLTARLVVMTAQLANAKQDVEPQTK